MARLDPLPRSALAEFEPVFQIVETTLGFVPNSMFTMGRIPALLQGFAGMVGAVFALPNTTPELKQLVAYVASQAAGCRYCQAHTSSSATRAGASEKKVQAAFEFETSPLFDDAERAALRVARDAALQPSEVTDDHFRLLREHYSEEQILEIVAMISAFGFLNRWNDTLATTLEDEPLAFARTHLDRAGWEPGAHG